MICHKARVKLTSKVKVLFKVYIIVLHLVKLIHRDGSNSLTKMRIYQETNNFD